MTKVRIYSCHITLPELDAAHSNSIYVLGMWLLLNDIHVSRFLTKDIVACIYEAMTLTVYLHFLNFLRKSLKMNHLTPHISTL